MSWQDRLRPVIKFVSPSGLEFAPLWKGDDISAEKRLGRHAYPNVDKEVVQDMGMNSADIPLTVFFDGVDHDKNAADFQKALYESGVWKVTHPVYGLMRLQLVSYKMAVQPVESGNVTEVETEWLEPADDEDVSPVEDPAAKVEAAVKKTKWETIKDMAAMVQKTVSQVKSTAQDIKGKVDKVKAAVRNIADLPNRIINEMQSVINEVSMEVFLDVASISGSIISLIEAPALISGSVSSKVAMFASLGERIMSDLSGGNSANTADTANAVNSALTSQLFLNAITIAMAQAVISDTPETRREALSALNEYRRFTGEAQAALDKAAEMTADSNIESQFVARANSGEAIADLNAAVAKYLMGAMFNLKIERRITLDRQRSPLEIAINELGGNAGNADELYERFCAWNSLHGRELLLLPAGREVVIYG